VPWWAEIPLVAVSVATVVGFMRIYNGWDFLGPLLAFALGAHATAIVCRRLRLPGVVVVAVAIVGTAFAVAWILFPATTSLGLPTADTWAAASASLRFARERYPEVVAPTTVLPGFQLAAGVALWIAAWFGDWAAHRLRATAEAVAATTAIFVFCSVLGSGRGQVVCAAAFAGAVLVFVGVQRSLAIERDQSWLPTNRTTASAMLRSAGLIAVIALVAGVVVGPELPGAGSESAISWRGGRDGDQSRVTISPMVEIRKRLVQQSNREVFRVRSSEPAYWRLTSLDSFDGEIWSSSGEFKRAGDRLPSSAPTGEAFRAVTQEVTIEGLAAIWAPSAFEAVSVRDSETPLRWDPDSSTLIVDASKTTSDGLSYSVVSQVPEFGVGQLRRSDGPDPEAIRDRYLGLPADFPFLASNLAREVTGAADSRYDQALALQDWFRTTFDYSLAPDNGHGDDALVDFLRSGQGYCEQFAGAFAAMARSLDIPARVAVGFTPGTVDPDDPDLYRVYGRHAHAWPEVYFPSTGGVAFEPTPGRGMPGAEEYTGVRAEQDPVQPVPTQSTSTTAVATTTTIERTDPNAGVTQPPASERAETAGTDTQPGADDHGTPWPVAAGVVALLLAIAAAVVVRRRRRTRRVPLAHPDQVWASTVAVLVSRHGLVLDPSLTHLEVAEQAAPSLDEAAAADLRSLAALVSEARWSPTGLDAADEQRLDDLAAAVVRPPQERSLSLSPSASSS
jgi:transglutaminase-like putative cysteine protease